MMDTAHLAVLVFVIAICVAVGAAYLAYDLFKKNRQLSRERLHYMQQAARLLDENRKLTAPKPPPPRRTAEEWETKHEAERAEQREKQLQDVQRDNVIFTKQKILSGGELTMFYAASDITNQPCPKGPYPFYAFPQVSLGEVIKTSSPRKWQSDDASTKQLTASDAIF